MLSRIIGFGRDMLIAWFLGATMWADAFFVALRFPNLFRSLFAEGTLNVSFVPIFSSILKQKGKSSARVFAMEAFSILFYILLVFTIIMELLMPFAMIILAPGFDEIPEKIEATTHLSHITFPFLMCVSLVSLLSGILNSLGKFAAAAFSPCILNLMMILSLVCLTPFLGSSAETAAKALAWGVFAAGIMELVFLFYNTIKAGYGFGLLSPFYLLANFSKDLKLLFKRMLPGILGSGVYQINLFLDTFFVSFVGAGAMSWLNYAQHLFQLPIGIIGVAIGTALLPSLSRSLCEGKHLKAGHDLNRGLEVSLVMALASMIGLMVLALPIVSVLFEHGAFTSESSIKTAAALKAFAIGLPAYMLTKALSPFFYAKGDTKTPVRIACVGVFVNACLCLSLMFPLGHMGIALATGITVWVNAFQYIFLLKKRGEFKLDTLFKYRFIRISISSLVMLLGLWGTRLVLDHFYPDWYRLQKGLSVIPLGAVIVFGAFLYFSCLIMTKTIRCKDIKKFLLIKRKRA